MDTQQSVHRPDRVNTAQIPTITPAPLVRSDTAALPSGDILLAGGGQLYWRRHLTEASLSSKSRLSLSSIWSVSCASEQSSSLSSSSVVTTGTTQQQPTGSSTNSFANPVTSLTTVIPYSLTLDSTTIATQTTSLVIATLAASTSLGPGTSTPLSTSTPTLTLSQTPASASQPMDVQAASLDGAICAGHGIDVSAEGVLATVVLTSLIGLIIWLIFAVLRPKLPQLYAVREWFLNPEPPYVSLRPRHLSSGLLAFLHPPVPIVPALPEDTSAYGNSPVDDAHLFPSDEQLSQRLLWVALLIALGWTLLGLIGALPLYLVSTPCLANSSPSLTYGSAYSTLTDLSLVRLLRMYDNYNVSTSDNQSNVMRRAVIDGHDRTDNARARLIVLTVLTILLGVLPVLWKLWKEFRLVANYRARWLEVRCGGIEMGWLSIRNAPGFTGWGEGRLKDFLLKNAFSSGMDRAKTPKGPRRDASNAVGRQREVDESARSDIDIQGFYTIPETHRLSALIDERDAVLNELEVAEAEYIAAFQLASVANEEAELERTESQNRRRSLSLGKPRTLGSTHSRSGSPGSPAPTSYLAPKSYYKLKGMSNVTEDGFSNRSSGLPASEFGTITAPDIRGSRFQQDPNRESIRFMPAEGGYPPMPFGGNHAGPNREDSAMATDQFGQPIGHRGPPPEGDQKQAFPVTDSPAHEIAPQGPPVVERNLASPVDGASSIRPISGQDERLPLVYMSIRQARSRLKALNAEVNDLQQEGFNSIAEGTRIKGWLLFGRGIRHVPGIQMIEGRSKEDIRWDELQDGSGMMRGIAWWLLIAVVGVALGAAFIPVVGLAMAGAPNFAQYLSFLRSISDGDSHNFGAALATTLAPAIVATLFISIAAWVIHYSSKFSGKPSVSTTRLAEFKAVFAILVIVCTIWLVTLGGLLFATDAISRAQHRGASVAEGTIYIAILLMLIIVNVAIISPGLLMLQPVRLWRVLKAQRKSITPRQRFRAIYPRSYNPAFGLGCCVLGVVFACAFSLIFPLIGPPIVLLLLLTLVAHRYLVGYVYGHVGVGQTGGLLHLWMLRRFATLVALQPLLLGLIMFSRDLWGPGAVLVVTAVVVIIAVEAYAEHKTRLPGSKQLSPITRDALDRFKDAARGKGRPRSPKEDEGSRSQVSSTRMSGRRPRTSIASVLDMISLTLAVMPSTNRTRGPVPMDTEGIDDIISTERAARTRPGASPRVAFTDRAEETAGMLYPPELLAPTPIIWLPNDPNGVGRSEAYDLQRYHGLEVTLDAVHERGRSSDSQTKRRSMAGTLASAS